MSDIIINEVSKSFGEKVVLDCFSARISSSSCCCIMGPSGCGKTTLVNILLGIIKADKGAVFGTDSKTAAVFQEDRLCEDFSALTNAAIVCGRKNRCAAKEILCELGLSENINTPVKNLSGGMKRRVAIARALAANGDLLIMDEPFKGLDTETRQIVTECVKNHSVGKTVIFITHDEDEAQLMSANIIRM